MGWLDPVDSIPEPEPYIIPEGYNLSGGAQKIGLTCNRCGLLVGNIQVHNAWHDGPLPWDANLR